MPTISSDGNYGGLVELPVRWPIATYATTYVHLLPCTSLASKVNLNYHAKPSWNRIH
jgi:hypothetical protein